MDSPGAGDDPAEPPAVVGDSDDGIGLDEGSQPEGENGDDGGGSTGGMEPGPDVVESDASADTAQPDAIEGPGPAPDSGPAPAPDAS